MTDQYRQMTADPGDLYRQFKLIGSHPTDGSAIYAEVVALDSGSIAGSSGLTDTQLRASAVPVSLATLPSLAAGAALIGKFGIDQTTDGTTNKVYVGNTIAATIAALTDGSARIGGTVAVSGTFFQATQPVSAASLPLPSGAATSAKQDSQTTLLGGGLPSVLTSDRLKVDVAGQTIAATIATLPALTAGSAVIGHVIVDTAPTTAVTIASLPSGAVTNVGTFAVQAAQSGTWTAQIGNTQNTTPILVTSTPATSGGWSVFMASAADGSTALTNTAQAIKASAGQLGGWYISNPNTTSMFVSVYNTAAASVTVGTTNPLIQFEVPAQAAANLNIPEGLAFGTAISCAATTTAGGNSAPTTALNTFFWYK